MKPEDGIISCRFMSVFYKELTGSLNITDHFNNEKFIQINPPSLTSFD